MDLDILLGIVGLVVLAVILMHIRDANQKRRNENAVTESSYQTALNEIESGLVDDSIRAQAYAHTETEDTAKRYYVRERSKAIDKEKDSGFRNVSFFVWFSVIAFYGLALMMQTGEFSFISDAKLLRMLVPDTGSVFIWASIITSIRVVVFLLIHKIISGHSFGKWPILKQRRPRAFLAIWVGLFSTFLVNCAVNFGVYLYDPDGVMARESLGFALINFGTFLMWCVPGLVLAFLYKLKVR